MITLKGLDFTRSRNWLKKADDCREQDPISSFIFAWISFNHYYSTHAFEYSLKFNAWRRERFGNRSGDKAELLFLIHSPDFTEFLGDYKQLHPQRLNTPIELPVYDKHGRSPVPKNVTGVQHLSDLTDEALFVVIYRVRNNLLHGSKDPMRERRDRNLCATVAEFMVPLVASLLDSTGGEVLNAYDGAGEEAREQIRKLAEA